MTTEVVLRNGYKLIRCGSNLYNLQILDRECNHGMIHVMILTLPVAITGAQRSMALDPWNRENDPYKSFISANKFVYAEINTQSVTRLTVIHNRHTKR